MGTLDPKKGHSILVVDDEPSIRSTLCRLFGREGIHCLLASNSEDAFIFLKKRKVSVVFSDAVIPGYSGIEFLSEVKQRYPMISRVCVSGRVDRKAIAAAIQTGVVSHFIAKPWSNSALKKTLYLAIRSFERNFRADLSPEIKCADRFEASLGDFSPQILVAEEKR